MYLGALAAVLQYQEEFRVCMTEYQPMKAIPEFKMLCPDVLIFEAVNNTSEIGNFLRKEHGRLIIIAVTPETDSIEVLYGKDWFTSSIDNLVQVIRGLT